MAKKEKTEVPEIEEPLADDALEVLPIVEPIVGEPAAPGLTKRSMGAKEPIPFKWKILGSSGRVILTLFKSVEREDADAQLERLTKDGYYTGLRIADINEKIEQPPMKEAKKSITRIEKGGKIEKPDKPDRAKKASPPERQVKGAKGSAAVKSGAVKKVTKVVEKSVAKAKSAPKSAVKGSSKSKVAMKKR